jgi:hypothetical protein
VTRRAHAATWWYVLAERWFPERCREIPEPQTPDRIMLRQVALVYRYAYLQQFASSEHTDWMHSHQWKYTFSLGLWGNYIERRLAGPLLLRHAPYAYWMDASVIHQVLCPSAGHTSLFVGLFRDDDLKHYYPSKPYKRLWSDHIKVMVKRI